VNALLPRLNCQFNPKEIPISNRKKPHAPGENEEKVGSSTGVKLGGHASKGKVLSW